MVSGINSVIATEIVHYKNIPVTIELRNGEERTIQFGDHVKVGLTKGQSIKNLFRIQSAQGAVHIKPNQEFDKQRIQIRRISDGRVILLDLMARAKSANEPPLEEVRILLDSENTVLNDDQTSLDGKKELPTVTPVDLTRYVSQRLYGPSRLHYDRPGIIETTIGVDGLIRIFKGDNKFNTTAKAVLAYQGGGYYIAAIHIKNITKEWVNLNYLELNLPFSYATFQHHVLYPNGTPGDSTMLYLISDKPLKETLYPWTYYHDLRLAEQAKTKDKSKPETKNDYESNSDAEDMIFK